MVREEFFLMFQMIVSIKTKLYNKILGAYN